MISEVAALIGMVTNQLFCSLISWLVSTSWVDIQYPQSMFFHECKTEKWPSFTTFLKICKHVSQFIISARALTKVFVPPQHHLFSRLAVIPMSNTRWFLTFQTDALQTWTSDFFWQFSVFWWLQEDVQYDEKPSWGQCFSTGRLSADRVATA